MPTLRRLRLLPAVLGLSMLAGCVVAPVPIAPLPAGQAYFSQQCLAGFYQCVLPQPGQVGTPCSCPGLGAPSYGTIR